MSRIEIVNGRPIAYLPAVRGRSVTNQNNSFTSLSPRTIHRQYTTNQRDPNESGFAAILAAAIPAISSIVSALPGLGVGSKARRKEIQAQADANEEILKAQNENEKQSAKDMQKLALIIGTVILVIVVLIFALRK